MSPWKRISFAPLAVVLLLAVPHISMGATPSAVIIVRHGEKAQGDGDVPLMPAGQRRAQALARTLGGAGIKSIYTSQTKRTQDTARPLARQLHLQPQIIPKGQIDTVAQRLRASRPGEVALLVWHVDELPEIVHKLGGTLAEYGNQEYDRLVILTLIDGRVVKVLTLRYGQ